MNRLIAMYSAHFMELERVLRARAIGAVRIEYENLFGTLMRAGALSQIHWQSKYQTKLISGGNYEST